MVALPQRKYKPTMMVGYSGVSHRILCELSLVSHRQWHRRRFSQESEPNFDCDISWLLETSRGLLVTGQAFWLRVPHLTLASKVPLLVTLGGCPMPRFLKVVLLYSPISLGSSRLDKIEIGIHVCLQASKRKCPLH